MACVCHRIVYIWSASVCLRFATVAWPSRRVSPARFVPHWPGPFCIMFFQCPELVDFFVNLSSVHRFIFVITSIRNMAIWVRRSSYAGDEGFEGWCNASVWSSQCRCWEVWWWMAKRRIWSWWWMVINKKMWQRIVRVGGEIVALCRLVLCSFAFPKCVDRLGILQLPRHDYFVGFTALMMFLLICYVSKIYLAKSYC